MDPANPYQSPAPAGAVEAIRLLPGASLIRGLAFGLLIALVVIFGTGQFTGSRLPPSYGSFLPSCTVILLGILSPWLAQRKKYEDLRASPPHFEGAQLLCAGLGRVKSRGWLVKDVFIFVTSRAVVLREKLGDPHRDVILPFEQIASVGVRGFSVQVTQRDGQTQRIIVSHPKRWLQEIEAARQGRN